MKAILLTLVLAAAHAADPKAATAPPADEQLNYTINWPTGLSLGEATLRTQRIKGEGGGWQTDFSLDASVPGFAVVENAKSKADAEFCSLRLDKQYTRGKRKSEESTSFDTQSGKATRETKGGGKSEINAGHCGRDPLAYLDFLRRELSQGRLPPHQTVYFGAAYRISVQFGGTQQVMVSGQKMEADRLIATLKGDKADVTFDVFFAKDPARTPVLVKVPFQLATFSMELVR